MKLLARLRLCLALLTARRARDWRVLTAACTEARMKAAITEILATIAASEALEAERAQVSAGTRTTHEAATLLAQAQRMVQPKP